MNHVQQEIISRQSLLWLLAVNIAVLAPLYDKFTPWTLAICGICLLWRYGIFIGKVAKPPRYLVTLLALGSATTLALIAAQIGMLNALMNLLILGYALKYIEMRNRRDVRAVVVVGYFLIALGFISHQSIFYTTYLSLVTVINTCVLVSLYREDVPLLETARIGIKLILLSLPLAALLFLIMPRLPPLWLVPQLESHQTGLSDVVSFGAIGKLTRSAALAFRAEFDNAPPANHQLYWRALVMEDYDGKQWSQNIGIKSIELDPYFNVPSPRHVEGPALYYSIIAEPSHQHWLFGLDVAMSHSEGIINLPDYRLYALSSLEQKFQYQVQSYPQSILDLSLSPVVEAINLHLPDKSNPRTRQLALEFRQNYPDPIARLAAMMHYFTTEPYFYTLTPPRVGPQQIDDFLLENKSGFCVHYATAFTFMARASGLPARLVTGYQGGEWNQQAGYLSVYQYMAHAWSEVWIEGLGWQRYDPTVMIAPERVNDGFDAYFSPSESYLINSPFSVLRLRDIPLLNEMRLALASVDFYWSLWVLGFDSDRQKQVLTQLLGQLSPQKMALFMLLSFGFIALAIAVSAGLIQLKTRGDKLTLMYLSVSKKLALKGISRRVNEGPLDLCTRVCSLLPELSDDFSLFTQYYVALKYQQLTPRGKQQLGRLYMSLARKLKRKIARAKLHRQPTTAKASKPLLSAH